MKVFYLNDSQCKQQVFTVDLNSRPVLLIPADGKLFEFDAPEGSVPFVKVWNTRVLISFVGIVEEVDE